MRIFMVNFKKILEHKMQNWSFCVTFVRSEIIWCMKHVAASL